MQPKIVLFLQIIHQEIQLEAGIYILAISTPPPGNFLSKLKNREEFEGGLEKKKGKRGEKKKKEE